jgi:hypothetical protein
MEEIVYAIQIQHGNIEVYGKRNSRLWIDGPNLTLLGFTSTSVTVRFEHRIETYDAKHRLICSNFV